MSSTAGHEVTQLLIAWNNGDDTALDKLIPLVHRELHRMAKGYMHREKSDHLLQTTALVNEAYLKLIDARQVRWQNRAHFLAIASSLMRRILVDYAREQGYQKRGGGMIQVTLDEFACIDPGPNEDVLALDEALQQLAEFDERKSRVVEMRYYGGLTEEEIAVALDVSAETVKRDWRLAKTWLLRRLNEGLKDEERDMVRG